LVETHQVAGPDDVVAGIVVRSGHVLLCHRSTTRAWYPDVWDLPGGHVEIGESPTRALVRELREELGIVIEEPSDHEFSRVVTSEFDMRIWVVNEWVGVAVNAAPQEHDEVAWMSVDEIAGLALAHGSYLSVISRALTVGH
jgi:mutator protein MutT